MPHVVVDLLALARRNLSPSVALCSLLAACSRSGELRVVVDSTAGASAVEVLALPFDPARLAVVPTRARAPASDDVTLYYAASDSADSLDALFQRERSALNAEAMALHSVDRRSRDYFSRYRAFEQRAAAATRLRAERDRLRARRDDLHARLGATLRDEGARPPSSPMRAALDSAGRLAGRAPVRSAISNGAATLHLPPGDWWVTLARRDGTLLTPAAVRQVRAGARDTLKLQVPGSGRRGRVDENSPRRSAPRR